MCRGNKKDNALRAFLKTFIKFFFFIPWLDYSVHAVPLEFPTGSLLRDGEIEGILHDFSDPILRLAGVNPNDVRIYVLSSPDFNAFSALGNLIVVYTELILKTDIDEFIAVLAHEIGHLAGRHSLRSSDAINQALAGVLGGALVGIAAIFARQGDAALAGFLGGLHAAERSLLAYSRGQESAADQAAVRYLTELHWPLQGLVDITKRFQDKDLLSENRQYLYIRTHPLGKERHEVAEAALQRFSGGILPPAFHKKFELMKMKIFAYTQPAKQVLQKYKGSSDALGHYAQAIAFDRLGDKTQALTHVNKLLTLEKSKPDPYVYELKAQLLFNQNNLQEAIINIKKALSLSPSPSPLLKVSAAQMMVESENKTYIQEAIDLLESVKLKERESPEVWRLFSVAYGKQGEMGKMSLALAEMALLEGNLPRAKSQCQRALHFLPPQSSAALHAQDILKEIENGR